MEMSRVVTSGSMTESAYVHGELMMVDSSLMVKFMAKSQLQASPARRFHGKLPMLASHV